MKAEEENESPHEDMTPQCICYSVALPKRG